MLAMTNRPSTKAAEDGNRRAGRAPVMAAGKVLVAPVGFTAASANDPANSEAVGKRSAGTGANALEMTCSTDSGTVGRIRRTDGTSPLKRRAITACGVGPVKGGSPARTS